MKKTEYLRGNVKIKETKRFFFDDTLDKFTFSHSMYPVCIQSKIPDMLVVISHSIRVPPIHYEEPLFNFQRLADAAGYGMGRAGSSGYIQYANTTLCRWLGKKKLADLIGRHVSEFYPKTVRKNKLKEIFNSAKMFEYVVEELPLCSSAGNVMNTVQAVFITRCRTKDSLYFTNLIIDITEGRKAEQEKNRIIGELRNLLSQSKSRKAV